MVVFGWNMFCKALLVKKKMIQILKEPNNCRIFVQYFAKKGNNTLVLLCCARK